MSTDNDGKLTVEIWSDFVCPFSYMGEHKLRDGIAQSDVPVRLVFRSYQLRPDLPPDTDVDFVTMMAERRGLPVSKVREMTGGAAKQAAELGLRLDYSRTRATNTRRAHMLAHFARANDYGDALIERLFKAYFTDGLLISDPAILADLAAEVGLDRDDAVAALSDVEIEAQVEADIAMARRLGISSVPHIVIDGRTALSGAHPPASFAAALREAQAQ